MMEKVTKIMMNSRYSPISGITWDEKINKMVIESDKDVTHGRIYYIEKGENYKSSAYFNSYHIIIVLYALFILVSLLK